MSATAVGRPHMRSTAISLLICCLTAFTASAQNRSAVAGRLVSEIAAGNTEQCAALFHYPSSYSESERAKDAAGVAESLAWLLAQVGKPSDITPHGSPAVFYPVGVFGGTNAYWESISPINETQFIYRATFASLGSGFIQVSVFEVEGASKPEIRAVGFGIPARNEGGLAKAIDLMLGLIEHANMPVPPDFRDTLEQQLQAITVNPAR